MADVDAALLKGLKAAKSKKQFFAFIPKGGSDGKLIVQKTKIKPADIAAAKKEIGGGMPVTGKCLGPITDMIFTTAKPAPATLANCLKVVTGRDAGIRVVATFQLAADADAEEPEGESEGVSAPGSEAQSGAVVGAAPPAPPIVSPGDPASGQAADAATAVPEAPPTPPRVDVDLPRWTAARQGAINALKALAAKVAATRHGDAAGVVKEIAALIGRLPANPQPNQIDALKAMITSDDAITAAEESPKHFHDVVIRQPLLDSLELLRS